MQAPRHGQGKHVDPTSRLTPLTGRPAQGLRPRSTSRHPSGLPRLYGRASVVGSDGGTAQWARGVALRRAARDGSARRPAAGQCRPGRSGQVHRPSSPPASISRTRRHCLCRTRWWHSSAASTGRSFAARRLRTGRRHRAGGAVARRRRHRGARGGSRSVMVGSVAAGASVGSVKVSVLAAASRASA